jgi:hypothetical protein
VPIRGRWRLVVAVRPSDGGEARASANVPIR